MDENVQIIPGFDDYIDDDGSTNLYEVSTVLVAHILEVKKRASEMELIFCKNIYPAFQSKTKSLQKKLVDAVKNTNDEWAKRESSILQQIEDLRCEKQHALEEIKQLKTSLDETNKELATKVELFRKSEHEKEQLLTKMQNLKEQLSNKIEEVIEGKKLQEKLLQQIDFKDQNLLTEQSKKKCLYEEFSKLKENYKHLKSQYTFLLGKIGDGKSTSPSPCSNKRSPQDSNHRDRDIPKPIPVKMEPEDTPPKKPTPDQNDEDAPPSKRPTTIPKTSHKDIKPDHTSKPPTSKKRSTSSWRETRTHEENQRGADPHDDFLNTPIESARNLMMNMDPEGGVQDDTKLNISDDETQEVIVPPKQGNGISVMGPSVNKGYKYAEPVRKKSEREKLKGVECRQCKKFYDAVLGDGSGSGGRSMRCEHHEGVSRHRYRYAPPMTPEGFWNIGFESEM